MHRGKTEFGNGSKHSMLEEKEIDEESCTNSFATEAENGTTLFRKF